MSELAIYNVEGLTEGQESPTSCASKEPEGNEHANILGCAKQYTAANGKRCTVDESTFAAPFVHDPASAKYSEESASLVLISHAYCRGVSPYLENTRCCPNQIV